MAWRTARFGAILLVLGLLVAVPFLPAAFSPGSTQAAGPAMTGLHAVGNRIVNADGQTVRLLGVNRSGMEFACVQGWGIFDGPNDAASVEAMSTWKINTVRIPLNEDCWLGINGVPAAYGGANYRAALANYVGLLNSYGLAVILDLHWAAPGTTPATGQQQMPNRDHSITFWQQIANTYKGNTSVVFDLYNEPFPDSNQDTSEAWRCWRDGGTCAGIAYQAAGMQELVNAVRGTGATNLVMVGGVGYAGILSQWLTYRPTDSLNNLAASWHVYNFSWCPSQSCWESMIAPVAAQVPVVTGEIGESDCAHGFVDPLMNWLDSKGISYLGWTWNTWDCGGGPALISNYNGTPTNFGQGIKDHFAVLAGGTSSPTPTSTIVPTPTVGATTVTDPLDNFNYVASRSPNLGFDTTNTATIGNDPSRLVRGARNAEWAVWSMQGMTTFTAVTYHYIWEGTIGTFTFDASPDGTTYTPATPTVTDRGGDWKRIDYALTLPAGTNFVRVTFPNISAYEWTPQIGQVSYSRSATTSPSPTPTNTAIATNTPTRTATATATNTPVASPTATRTPMRTSTPTRTATPTRTSTATRTPTKTATASSGPAPVRVTAMLGGSSATQETQYRVRLHNDGTTPQNNLSLRIYVDLSEVFAAGLNVGDLTTDEFWDQCGTANLGPYTRWSGNVYYVELRWQGQTFAPGSSCEVQFRLRTANWQTAWNAANDYSPQGLDTATYRQTARLPVYRNGTRIYGTEP
ncbi:MAG: cellulase family glycosylhydrolase [Thermomicrobiales bacterium]